MSKYTMQFISLVLLSTVACSFIPYKNQADFDSFVQFVDDERTRSGPFEKPESEDFTLFYKAGYGIDRHGRPFIKCREFDSKNQTKTKNIRCHLTGTKLRPACYAMYDYTADKVTQGCTHYKADEADFCDQKKCSMGRAEGEMLGYCCCTGDKCNDRDQVTNHGESLFELVTAFRKENGLPEREWKN